MLDYIFHFLFFTYYINYKLKEKKTKKFLKKKRRQISRLIETEYLTLKNILILNGLTHLTHILLFFTFGIKTFIVLSLVSTLSHSICFIYISV